MVMVKMKVKVTSLSTISYIQWLAQQLLLMKFSSTIKNEVKGQGQGHLKVKVKSYE